MNFSDALGFLKQGQKICRFGWNDTNHSLSLTTFIPTDNTPNILKIIKFGSNPLSIEEWNPIQEDILAEDWMVIG